MTLKQLQYAIKVAETGSITEAAKSLYIAQPSLTASIHELEKEYHINIFTRSNKGIELTAEGDEFLGYARQVIEQTNLIEERYNGKAPGKQRFCVSSQHYSFVVEAFVELLREHIGDKYEFHMRETQTYEIIDDVAHLRSEIGVLYLNRFNETVIRKVVKDNGLTFHTLFVVKPHVFIGKNSPLAEKEILNLDDLKPYPRLSYEQGSHNAFYLTLFNLLVGLNGYTICSGVINEELNGSNIIARPLDVDDYMEIGYILPSNMRPSPLTSSYIKILKRLTV